MENYYNRKHLLIFFITTFGVQYILGIFMAFGYNNGVDISIFSYIQMHTPAAGLIFASVLIHKKSNLLPKQFFLSYLIFTILLILIGIMNLLFPNFDWLDFVGIFLAVEAVILWIYLVGEKNIKKDTYGLTGKNLKLQVKIVLGFMSLYTLRVIIQLLIFEEPVNVVNLINWEELKQFFISLPMFLVCFSIFLVKNMDGDSIYNQYYKKIW